MFWQEGSVPSNVNHHTASQMIGKTKTMDRVSNKSGRCCKIGRVNCIAIDHGVPPTILKDRMSGRVRRYLDKQQEKNLEHKRHTHKPILLSLMKQQKKESQIIIMTVPNGK